MNTAGQKRRNDKLVCFGETMVRLSPVRHHRLEQATLLDVKIGGSELNAAIAATRLGLRAAYVSRLTTNALGRMIENGARQHGIDTSHILWTEKDRVGLYFVEFGASPRVNSVLYDRRGSAMTSLAPGDIDWCDVFREATAFHTSGITPALSPSAAQATMEAVRQAKSAGLLVSIDLNYRAKLWSEAEARQVMSGILQSADMLITTEEDTKRVFDIEMDSYEAVARRLADMFGLKAVAITLRENKSVLRNTWTAIAYDAVDENLYRAPTFEIEVVDRVGSGDSFAGGFLYGYLKEGAASGVRYGVAISAIKQTHPGDPAYATLDEVHELLATDGAGSLRISR